MEYGPPPLFNQGVSARARLAFFAFLAIALIVVDSRLKVLEIFQRGSAQGSGRHMSAEDVYKALIAENIDVGLATVYRVLTQFEQAGLLARNHFEGGRAMFELNEGSHHDHLVCLTCGRVEEFVDAEIERRQHSIAAVTATSWLCSSNPQA